MDPSSKERDMKLINFLKKTKASPPKLNSSAFVKQSTSLDTSYSHSNNKLKAQNQLSESIVIKNPSKMVAGTIKAQSSHNSYKYKSLEGHVKQDTEKYNKRNKIAIVVQQDQQGERQHFKRRQVVTSMDNKIKEESFRVTQGKLYQINFRKSKAKALEKTKRSGVNYLKIANLPQYDPNHTSASFSTYYQFQSYINSLMKQSKPEETLHSSDSIQKKFGIMPALKPSVYRQKKCYNKSEIPSQNLRTLQQYLISKRAGRHKQKELIIESKKHEMVENVIRLKSKVEKQKLNRGMNRNSDITPEELVTKVIQEQQQKIKKVESPSRLSQIKKKAKHIPYFMNSSLEKSVYQQKIASYREMIFMVNLAHRVYDPVIILEPISLTKLEKNAIARYNYYVGSGNNSMLIRSLMKRRIWWSETKNMQEAHFVWTQLKVQSIFEKQPSNPESENSQKQEERIDLFKDQEEELVVLGEETKKKKKKKKILEEYLTIQQCNPFICETIEKPQKTHLPKGLVFRAPFQVKDEEKILTQEDAQLYANIMTKIPLSQIQDFEHRLKYLPKTFSKKGPSQEIHCHNHIEGSHSLGNKKALLHHLQLYYQLTGLPQDKAFPPTYHIRQGQTDPNYKLFIEHFRKIGREQPTLKNIWIMKPGENTNRGNGIVVVKDLRDIRRRLNSKQKHFNGEHKTFILQKYIQRPLLYRERKFDIRQFMIITSLHGRLRAYFFGEGYIRTSSYFFNLDDIKDATIHLTNDAVQKQCEDYGCFEAGNKVSFNDLQKYYSKAFPEKCFNINQIYSKMRDLAKDAVLSTCVSLDPEKKLHNFEVFGLDFMIDEDLKVYLIEVNTNPCLELSSNLLTRLIPLMVEQTFRVSLDTLFPPPSHYTNNTRYQAPDCQLDKFQFQLIFDEEREGQIMKQLYTLHREQYEDMLKSLSMSQFQTDQVFQDEGQEIEVDTFI